MHAKRTKNYWSALNIVFLTEHTNPRGIWSVGNVVSYKNFEVLNTRYETSVTKAS